MNNKMNSSKPHIDRSMPKFVFLILHGNKRDRAFNDPEYKKTCNEKCHTLRRVLFKGREVINDTMPHKAKVQITKIFEIRRDFEDNRDDSLKIANFTKFPLSGLVFLKLFPLVMLLPLI